MIAGADEGCAEQERAVGRPHSRPEVAYAKGHRKTVPATAAPQPLLRGPRSDEIPRSAGARLAVREGLVKG